MFRPAGVVVIDDDDQEHEGDVISLPPRWRAPNWWQFNGVRYPSGLYLLCR